MEYIVKEKLSNGDYRVFDPVKLKTIVVDLFVDASCSFEPTEDIIGKTIIIKGLTPYAYFAENVSIK